MHYRPPGLSAGLAASLRPMPTALYEVYQAPSTCVDNGELAA